MEVIFDPKGVYKYSKQMHEALLNIGLDHSTIPYSGGYQYTFTDGAHIRVMLIKSINETDVDSHVEYIKYYRKIWEGNE